MPEGLNNETPNDSKKPINLEGDVNQGNVSAEPKDTDVNFSDVTEKDGKVIVDKGKYYSITRDLHTFKNTSRELKDKMNSLEGKLREYEEKDNQLKETKLKEEKKFEELLSIKEQENKELKQKMEKTLIDSALKTKALSLGINNVDDVKLANIEQIKIDPDSKQIIGVDEVLENLKTSKPYLFGSNELPGVKVDTGKPAGKNGLTFSDLMKDGKLALKVKTEDPAKYESLKREHALKKSL